MQPEPKLVANSIITKRRRQKSRQVFYPYRYTRLTLNPVLKRKGKKKRGSKRSVKGGKQAGVGESGRGRR